MKEQRKWRLQAILLRVAGTALAILILLGKASGITIPIAPGAARLSTGISNSTGNPLSPGPTEDSWVFYVGSTPRQAYVVRSDRPPISNGFWAANDSASQWISPTKQDYTGKKPSCCELPPSDLTKYIAALTFRVPAMTNPPNLPQWLLVMSGTVWADDSVTGFALYPGATPFGTPVYSYSYTAPFPGRLTPQPFSLTTWVNPNQQYTLAFFVTNKACSVTGFRLQMQEAYVTPEPGAWALMLSAGAGLAFLSLRRRRAKKPLP
jgi:hypothetical protein